MNTLMQLQNLFQAEEELSSPCPLEAVLQEWTPLFHTGVLLSKKTWFGKSISWLWSIASFFQLGDERSTLAKILHTAQDLFQQVLNKKADSIGEEAKELLVCACAPKWKGKIQQLACSLLHCSSIQWERTIQEAERVFSLPLLREMTFLPLPQPVLLQLASTKPLDTYQAQKLDRWIQEMQECLPSMDPNLVWNAFDSLLHGDECSSSQRDPCGLMLTLLARGLRFDTLFATTDLRLPREITVEKRMIPLSFDLSRSLQLSDDRFFFCKSYYQEMPMLLFASNNYIIPLWREHVSHGSTLFKVVDCYFLDESKRWALIERIEEKIDRVFLRDHPLQERARNALSSALISWMQMKVPFAPVNEDLWVTPSGTIVTFSPCRAERKAFSLVDIDSFITSVCENSPSALRKSLYESIQFFSQPEIVSLEKLLEERGCYISQMELSQECAARGIVDPSLFSAFDHLLHTLRSHIPLLNQPFSDSLSEGTTIAKKYLHSALEEGCFLFPSSTILQKLVRRI